LKKIAAAMNLRISNTIRSAGVTGGGTLARLDLAGARRDLGFLAGGIGGGLLLNSGKSLTN
jgi:hypothetical protein